MANINPIKLDPSLFGLAATPLRPKEQSTNQPKAPVVTPATVKPSQTQKKQPNKTPKTPKPCENSSLSERCQTHKLSKTLGVSKTAESDPALASKMRHVENPGQQSLIKRISASTKEKTVKDDQTNRSNTAQRAGKIVGKSVALQSQKV
ncbi:hypothetical protein PTTG_28143 [Puccinia triticina 1-1 BBBD Race 1]|uniref:Uncharacterized protein n=1 Tax=Puccinia triticina (isolate 1-1 / race 1 (BBBD)) TaxID=630390 RepID=A0A180GEV1_PUCT1|nr:hypothetical protein PTTG_28143 [Puccinia triticina 1-1 BBBD Race 1]